MKQLLTLSLGLFFFLFACGDDRKQVETLQKETMDIHDAAMKDMAEMNRTVRQVKDMLMAAAMTPEQSSVFSEALAAAGKAENEMMDWMRNYAEPKDKPSAEALQYLQQQKTAIEKNRENINNATTGLKKLLQK